MKHSGCMLEVQDHFCVIFCIIKPHINFSNTNLCPVVDITFSEKPNLCDTIQIIITVQNIILKILYLFCAFSSKTFNIN